MRDVEIERMAEGLRPVVGDIDRNIIERTITVTVLTQKPKDKFIRAFGNSRDYADFVMSLDLTEDQFNDRYDVWDCEVLVDIKVETYADH